MKLLTGVRSLAAKEVGLLLAFLLVAAMTTGFGLLAEEVLEGDTTAFDRNVALFFRPPGSAQPIGPAWMSEMARDVTALGSFVVLGLILLAVVTYLFLVRKTAMASLMLVAVLGGTLLSTVLKIAFNRPRPDLPAGIQVFTASFPSGHAMLSAVTFLTLGAILTRVSADRSTKAFFMGTAILVTLVVGLSRVYIGVHFATDVLAGWCLGAAWALLCWAVALRLQRRGNVEAAGAPALHPS